MGTRADFYIGTTAEAEWLGSVAFDAYPDGLPRVVRAATTEEGFRSAVSDELAGRDDATTPDMGWPWPWHDSGTTDYAYMLDAERGSVLAIHFGTPVEFDVDTGAEGETREGVTYTFPNMADQKAVTYGTRSGAMFFGVARDAQT